MTEYAPGVPMWVDVSSPDLDTSRAFYSGLFGWEAQVVPDPQAGGYTMFLRDGKMVAAGAPTSSPDQQSAWATYVCSSDADATAHAVQEAGGQVIASPMDVMGQGRLAVFTDPTGAAISVWQPQAHQGAELVNQPGSFCWTELYTRDIPRASKFYQRVFGWGSEETSMDNGAYTLFQVEGRPIAGGLDMSSMLPESVPPHWLVYFTVENTDQAVAKARALGATIVTGPQPTPMGPMAVIEDPVGAAFAIIQMAQES